ncbi:hypothetical protein M9Y10_029123 [Tritrichomonas musculus]|uniref:Uncharacterized protein n=1 Tax=Tritrichomonas musculus TaxID=1915356 RepID=A0ABR2KM46_9EUKA
MIHSQFLGSVFRSGTPKSSDDSYMEDSIVASGLLGKDPTDLVVLNRPPSALLQTPNSSVSSAHGRGKRFPSRRLFTPASNNRANTSMSNYNHNNSTISGGRSATAFAGSPSRLSSLSNSKRKKEQQEIDQFLQDLTERLNTAKDESVRPIDLDSEKSRPHTTIIDERLLKTRKTTEAPNVYFATILPPTTPASGTTFLQMSEVLDKMIDTVNLEKSVEPQSAIDNDESVSGHSSEFDQSVNHIFGEVVRQYFIECGSQGELLDKCRDCFMHAQRTIPNIKDHYRSILNALYAKREAIEREKQRMIPDIANNKEHSEHLLKVIAEMRNDLERLINHHDELVKSITSTSNESLKMKKSIEQLDKSIASQNHELVQLNDQLANLSKIASQYETDSLNFAENLKQVREQEKEAKKQIEQSNTQLRVSMQKVTRIDAEISSLSSEIEKIRTVTTKTENSIQVDLISRRLFRQKKEGEDEEVSARKKPIENDDETEEEEAKEKKKKKKKEEENEEKTIYDKVKKEFNESVGKSATDDLHINTYEDFSKMKKVLFKNDDNFHIETNKIEKAESGDFLIDGENANIDYIKLFASKLASDCLDAAIKSKPTVSQSTQTLSQQVEDLAEPFEEIEEIKGTSRLLSLIQSDYSNRESQSFEWFMSTMNMLYHEKEVQNQKDFESGSKFMDFPHFIRSFAEKKFELPFLRDQFLWDVFITSHHMKNQSIECELFVDFLDENLTEDQFAFFLVCRKDCLKNGSSVQVRTRDSMEKFNEFYLTVDQVETLLQKWWQNRYQKKFYLRILDFSVPRPAIHLEATKRYIATSDILLQCIQDYADDNAARLGELLLATRIVPRLKMPDFCKLVKSLIPDLSSEKVDSFYRATVSKGVGRREVSTDQLVDLFLAGSILVSIYSNSEDSFKFNAQNSEVMETVKEEFARYSPQFSKILEFFKQQTSLQNDNLTLKTFYDDAFRFFSMLNQSLSSGDGKSSYVNYYQFIFALDILFSALNLLEVKDDEMSLVSLECSVRENWLDTVFEHSQNV